MWKTSNDMNMRRLIIAIAAGLLCFAAAAPAQSFAEKGYSGSLEAGVMFQKKPFFSVSTSHGWTNGKGRFFGGGLMLTQRPDGRRVFYDKGERPLMYGVFIEYGNPCKTREDRRFDIKAGVKFNSDHLRYDPDLFLRPSYEMLLDKNLAFNVGCDLDLGQFVSKTSCDGYIHILFLPYAGLAFRF